MSSIVVAGDTSGSVTLQAPAVSGSTVLTLPAVSGNVLTSTSATLTGTTALRGSYGAGAITTNFAAGDGALVSNTTGIQNSAMGQAALYLNTTGNYNSAVGMQALQNNTTGVQNLAVGVNALQNNTTGNYNSAMGQGALQFNTTGIQNSAMGQAALYLNTTVVATFGTIAGGTGYTANLTASAATLSYVSGSTAISYPPVLITTNASGVVTACTLVTAADGTKGGTGFKDITTVMTCTTIGAGSGFAISPATLSTGSFNSAMGVSALQSNTTGANNSAVGVQALYSNTTGAQNSAMGAGALFNNTTGISNSAVGTFALRDNTTGSGNSAFSPVNSAGTYAPVFNPTVENNRVCMGSSSVTNAYIQVAWTAVSDARDKTNFAPVPHGLEFVNQLKPTAYQFKEDRETDVATGIVRYGFKAQDILALEGDTPVIIDTENLDKLRFNSDSLIPVLVNAIKELTARLELLEGK